MIIKICGITSPETAVACFEAGADMIGLVHCKQSPRHVFETQIHDILDAVKPFRRRGCKTVLVVVGHLPSVHLRFDYIQPYGDVWLDIPPSRLIRVVRDMESSLPLDNAPLYALEISSGPQPGGNGIAWDWSLAQPFCKRYPRTLLAGGISPDNVAEAIRLANPYGIDVSSGVESSPGIKDIDKVRRLIENIRLPIIHPQGIHCEVREEPRR